MCGLKWLNLSGQAWRRSRRTPWLSRLSPLSPLRRQPPRLQRLLTTIAIWRQSADRRPPLGLPFVEVVAETHAIAVIGVRERSYCFEIILCAWLLLLFHCWFLVQHLRRRSLAIIRTVF